MAGLFFCAPQKARRRDKLCTFRPAKGHDLLDFTSNVAILWAKAL
jgi:hypothetical protein